MTPPGLDERSLFEACLNKDADAFSILVQKYQSYIRALTFSATGDMEKSEEVAQDVFLIAWRNLSQLRDYSKLKSWLHQITKNEIIKYYRKESRDILSHSVSTEATKEIPTSQINPLDQALSRERQEFVRQAIERIPSHYREPLILFYWEGRSVRQVAEKFDLNEATAKKRISRAREMLKSDMAVLVEQTLSNASDGRTFSTAVIGLLGISELGKSSAAAAPMAHLATGTKIGLISAFSSSMTAKIAVIVAIVGLGTGTYLLNSPSGNSSPDISVLPPELNTGLVLYFSFDAVLDKGQPRMVLDESGHGNHGTLSGGTLVEGKIGRALQFNTEIKKDDVVVRDDDSLDLDAVTIVAWIKTDTLDDQWGRILDKGWATTYNLCIGGEFKGHRCPDKLAFECIGYSTTSQTSVVDGKWHFVACSYDGQVQKLYIDGNLDVKRVLEKKVPMKHNKVDIHIGSLAVPEAPPYHESFFDGRIDELRLYNRTLSDEEIQMLYYYNPNN